MLANERYFGWYFLLLTLIWALLIIALSRDPFSARHTAPYIEGTLHQVVPQASIKTLHLLHLLVRKMAHVIEYTILAILILHTVVHHLIGSVSPVAAATAATSFPTSNPPDNRKSTAAAPFPPASNVKSLILNFRPLLHHLMLPYDQPWPLSWYLYTLIIGVSFSVLDEYHQSLTNWRVASWEDCLIDGGGILLGLLLIGRYNQRRCATLATTTLPSWPSRHSLAP
jgi:VanZ family protein